MEGIHIMAIRRCRGASCALLSLAFACSLTNLPAFLQYPRISLGKRAPSLGKRTPIKMGGNSEHLYAEHASARREGVDLRHAAAVVTVGSFTAFALLSASRRATSRVLCRAVLDGRIIGTSVAPTPVAAAPRGHQLPAPPKPPPEFYELPLEAYAPHLSLSVASIIFFAYASQLLAAPWIGALAGACAVPLLFFQHDVGHALRRCRSQTHNNLCAATALITGTYWGASPWRVHTRHHCKTGDYFAWMVPDVDEPFGGDVDDFLGPLRQGNPLGADATKNPLLRAFLVAGCILASLFTFQFMFVIQAFAELRHYGHQKAGRTHGSRTAADEDAIRGAIITLIHVCFGLACMGPMGYLAFSIGMSGGLQIFAAAFHQPKGVDNYAPSHYYDRQVQSATNLKHSDNPLMHFLTFGASGYHIEHHLWENVPAIHLPKLANMARDYCKANGLEYREVTLTDAWSSWLQEGWRLSGFPPRV